VSKDTQDIELANQLDRIEQRMFLLKNEYQQHFLGLLKQEPLKHRNELESILRQLSRKPIQNTALNFRFQQLKARYSVLSLRWTRTMRQIEAGTYRRDLFRADLKRREREAAEQKTHKDIRKEAKAETDDKHDPARSTADDPSQLKALYQSFVESRRRLNESLDNIQYKKMVEFITKQTQVLKKQHGCRAVHFQVIEEGGKTRLKAVPRR